MADAQQNLRIDMEQTKWISKGEWRAPVEGIDAVRFTFGASKYKHDELGLNEIGVDVVKNIIKNREVEGGFELDHAAVATGIGALTGTWGARNSASATSAPTAASAGCWRRPRPTPSRASASNRFSSPIRCGCRPNHIVGSPRRLLGKSVEVAAQLDVTPLGDGIFGIDGQYDIVRATFTDGTNVPRIAPMRAGGGLWWRSAEWYTRVGLLHAFAQNDVSLNETPTAGYNLLRAEVSYTHTFNRTDSGPRDITVGLAGDNLLNEWFRNHISFKKAEVLQPGLGVRLFTNVRF